MVYIWIKRLITKLLVFEMINFES
ncbi:Protein of unknown function [Bacillus thuringiensis]|uniref:Uncharacterized protein n=1 Tax=Bacillus thuringiensis TaxID=1428 RepID=A0A1C4FER0_BACTU|nr:Protein of unknown function [Bacillus thuringiensis]